MGVGAVLGEAANASGDHRGDSTIRHVGGWSGSGAAAPCSRETALIAPVPARLDRPAHVTREQRSRTNAGTDPAYLPGGRNGP